MGSYRTNVYQLFDETDSRASVISVNRLFSIPEFDGNDPQAWLSRANLYFKKNPMDTVEEWDTFEKVKYFYYFMTGPAEIWFVETFTTQPKEDWECFYEKMLHHFTNPFEKKQREAVARLDAILDDSSNAEEALDLMLNGGPGCSSLDDFIYENGPFNLEVAKEGEELPVLHLNPYSWSKVSSIIYLDSPAGVGFSYSSDTPFYGSGDLQTATDTHHFLLKWFEQFPEFIANPFYISGESYAGVYVPTLATEVHKGIRSGIKPVIKLKGYMVGNGVCDRDLEGNALVLFAHGMGLISDNMFREAKVLCKGNYGGTNTDNCEKIKMISAKFLLLLLSLNVISSIATATAPPTCPADLGGDCADNSGEWKGEFFQGIPKIKYEDQDLVQSVEKSCVDDKKEGVNRGPIRVKFGISDKHVSTEGRQNVQMPFEEKLKLKSEVIEALNGRMTAKLSAVFKKFSMAGLQVKKLHSYSNATDNEILWKLKKEIKISIETKAGKVNHVKMVKVRSQILGKNDLKAKCTLSGTLTCHCREKNAPCQTFSSDLSSMKHNHSGDSRLNSESKYSSTLESRSGPESDCCGVVSSGTPHLSIPSTTAVSGEGWTACDIQLSPKRALRATMLKSRFASTIYKANHQVDKSDPITMQQERERLERQQLEEKARIEKEIKATEAGEGEDGRMKSAIGIGTLLMDGLGDTIRVSLAEAPEQEIDPCRRLTNLGMKASELQKGVVPFEEKYRRYFDFQHGTGQLPLQKESKEIDYRGVLHLDGSVCHEFMQDQMALFAVLYFRIWDPGGAICNWVLDAFSKVVLDVLL